MAAVTAEIEELLERWCFDWGVMDVMIAGKSSIDLAVMMITDWDDATQFLRSYGYDPDYPQHARFIHATIVEALHFFEKHLMPAEWQAGRGPSEEVLAVDDARHFLLWASEKPTKNRLRQAWACALLRVLHTIAHIEGVYRLVDLTAARDQIMRKFREHVFRDGKGQLVFGRGDHTVALHAIEWKHAKSRESIILKLLHKRANVAETIYDLLGIRIVTERLADVMLVVKYLREFYLITFPNCNPSRARNSLVDLEHFHKVVERLRERLAAGKLAPQDFVKKLEQAVQPMTARQRAKQANPHSGLGYRSIQLTCREMIHAPNPLHRWRQELKARAHSETALGFSDLVSAWGGDEPQMSSFFPFEVHVLDRVTYVKNQMGSASHDRYKQSQIKAARRRVLQRILTLKP